MSKSNQSDHLVYQLKITLKDSHLPIWRRILVKNNINLARLHRVIQIVMGWADYHLHHFKINDQYYGVPDPEWENDTLNEKEFSLNQLVKTEKKRFSYLYDFGDNWDHEILVEKILKPEPKKHYPACVTGKRACPPEDSGSIWGYYEKLKIMNDPSHPEHEEVVDWMFEDFDPDEFDLKRINDQL